jgi:hypothetical protein
VVAPATRRAKKTTALMTVASMKAMANHRLIVDQAGVPNNRRENRIAR